MAETWCPGLGVKHNWFLAYGTADAQCIAVDRFRQACIDVFINEKTVSCPHLSVDTYGVIGKARRAGALGR
jgi:hypothetical protein